jgi:prevent-host-death family protein
MHMQVNIHEAKTHFSKLVDRALKGEEIVIARNGKPLLELRPLRGGSEERISGLSRGCGWVAENFDAPLDPEIENEFYR